jgi:hypothetical protein
MGLNNFRTTRGVAGFTDLTATDIDVDTLDALELIDGSARKRPTAQLQSRSALSAPTNAESVVFSRAPVNDEAIAGTESVLTLLQSGIDPAMVMRRELDGQGGAYSHRLDAALGRFAKMNADLSIRYREFGQLPNWGKTTTSGDTVEIDYPTGSLKIVPDNDGSGSVEAFAKVGPSVDSVGPFSITFRNVDFTDGGTDKLRLGIADRDDSENRPQLLNDDSIFIEDGNSSSFPTARAGGSNIFTGGATVNFPIDVTIQYDGTEVRAYVDGELEQFGDYTRSRSLPLQPIIQIVDNGGGDTVSINDVIVEPIGGTF